MAVSEKLAKKKKWISIVAKEFKNQQIGETLVSDTKNLVDRKLSMNLMNLPIDVRGQNADIVFKIREVKDSSAMADIVSYNLTQSYVKRIVRKNVNKIDDSFVCESKDKIKMRFKPIIQTKFKMHNKTLRDLRKKAREILIENAKKQTYDEIILNVVSNKMQKNLMNKLKNISPLSVCGFRVVGKI